MMTKLDKLTNIVLSRTTGEILKIVKRDGMTVEYNGINIGKAVYRAMKEDTKLGVDEDIICGIEKEIFEVVKFQREIIGRLLTVESIQDLVENELLRHGRIQTAKDYIKYRAMREDARNRKEWKPYKRFNYLSDDFLRNYCTNPDPFKTEISKLTFYRTYSRFMPKENRRETWLEMNARVVEYMMELDKFGSKEKAEEMFDSLFNFEAFSSGRLRYSGGTLSIKRNFQSAFNCSYVAVDDISVFHETLYVLLLGSGVGYSVYKDNLKQLQPLRNDVEVFSKNYKPVAKPDRQEITTTSIHHNQILEVTVGDSKGGWQNALKILFDVLANVGASSSDRLINTILFNFDHVRPAGEPLLVFGGSASGYKPLAKMLETIGEVIRNSNGEKLTRGRVKLKSIDVIDIMGLIAEAVVSGGVRRSSLIALIDPDDIEAQHAKSNLYTQTDDGKWEVDKSIIHRSLSNNSKAYEAKPSRKELHSHIQTMKTSGEPGLVNKEEMLRRKSDAEGLNPCAEILLKSKSHCNLSVINMMKMIKYVDGKAVVDYATLYRSLRIATEIVDIISIQELDLYTWEKVRLESDRIIGVSITGYQDFLNVVKLSKVDEAKLLSNMRLAIKASDEDFSRRNNVEPSVLNTSVQPAGTVSILPDSVSAGMHFSHSPYYRRRIRINAKDPVCMAMVDSGYSWKPEVGQTIDNHTTKVFEFPVKAPDGKTKYDISAIEQLESYKMLMDNFVDHNVSSTIHVRNNEWDDVEQWLWDNWDSIVGVSFLSLDDSFYELLPYEALTEDEYNEMVKITPKFNTDFMAKYETGEEYELESSCEGGACPVR